MRLAEKRPATRAQRVFWNACMRCLHAACAVQAFVLAETQRQAELTYCQLMCPLQAQFGADPLSGTDPDDDTAPASGMHQHQALLLAVMRCGEVVYQMCIEYVGLKKICACLCAFRCRKRSAPGLAWVFCCQHAAMAAVADAVAVRRV